LWYDTSASEDPADFTLKMEETLVSCQNNTRRRNLEDLDLNRRNAHFFFDRLFPWGKKRPGREAADHSPPSNSEV